MVISTKFQSFCCVCSFSKNNQLMLNRCILSGKFCSPTPTKMVFMQSKNQKYRTIKTVPEITQNGGIGEKIFYLYPC